MQTTDDTKRGPGRPSRGKPGTPIYVRPTAEERAELEAAAKLAGLTIGDWVRDQAVRAARRQNKRLR